MFLTDDPNQLLHSYRSGCEITPKPFYKKFLEQILDLDPSLQPD